MDNLESTYGLFNSDMIESDIEINGVKQLVPRWAITSQELAKQIAESYVPADPLPTDIDLLAQAYKEGVNEA